MTLVLQKEDWNYIAADKKQKIRLSRARYCYICKMSFTSVSRCKKHKSERHRI